jgi:hypothetical protein
LQIRNLNDPYDCWRWSLKRLEVRYRDPYTARHSSISWNLMVDKNVLWVAQQHGHSVATMLNTYAAWTEGAKEADIEMITRAMESRPRADIVLSAPVPNPLASPGAVSELSLEPVGRRVSRGFRKEIYGGKGGTRTRDLALAIQ